MTILTMLMAFHATTRKSQGRSSALKHPADLSSKPAAKSRLQWVDCCKGICIILVVYGHVSGGLETSGVVVHGSALDRLRNWVYLFHMPAFFFLSGLFASRALKRPLSDFVANRLWMIAYPYILWTGIYLLVTEGMSSYSNTPPDAGAALEFLWKPYGYGLWFLYSLFLISVLFHYALTMRLPRGAVLVAAIGLHVVAGFGAFFFWPILGLAMLNFIYFAVGGLYAEAVFVRLSQGSSAFWLTSGVACLAVMTAFSFALGSWNAPPLDLVTAMLGVAGAVSIARGVVDSVAGMFLASLGFFSLEIYLGHPLFSTASRAILTHAGIHGAIPLVAVCVGAGVFASLALALACQKIRFPYLYRWPAEPFLGKKGSRP